MWVQGISGAPGRLSARQRRLKRRARRLCFAAAVRLAADGLFRFTHRAAQGKALWSDAVRAWIGNKTFIHWAIAAAHVDIPRIVSDTADAPDDVAELLEAVRAELTAYWADSLASLPSKSTPAWLPLP